MKYGYIIIDDVKDALGNLSDDYKAHLLEALKRHKGVK